MLLEPHEPIGEGALTMLPGRTEGRCTACGHPFGTGKVDIHHRNRFKRLNNLANLVMVHHRCHIDSVHGHPEWARGRGLIIDTTATPAETPLVLWNGREVMLSDDWPQADETGRWVEVEPQPNFRPEFI